MENWKEQPAIMNLLIAIDEDQRTVRLLSADIDSPTSRAKVQQALDDISSAALILRVELGLRA